MLNSSKEIHYKGYIIHPYQIKGEGGWNGWYAPIVDSVGNPIDNQESPHDPNYKKVVVARAKERIDSLKIS